MDRNSQIVDTLVFLDFPMGHGRKPIYSKCCGSLIVIWHVFVFFVIHVFMEWGMQN